MGAHAPKVQPHLRVGRALVRGFVRVELGRPLAARELGRLRGGHAADREAEAGRREAHGAVRPRRRRDFRFRAASRGEVDARAVEGREGRADAQFEVQVCRPTLSRRIEASDVPGSSGSQAAAPVLRSGGYTSQLTRVRQPSCRTHVVAQRNSPGVLIGALVLASTSENGASASSFAGFPQSPPRGTTARLKTTWRAGDWCQGVATTV